MLPDDASRLKLNFFKEEYSSLRIMNVEDDIKLKYFVIQNNICSFEH